jgi:hypothetical protein
MKALLSILRDHAKINSVIMAQEFCPLARRERRAYPASGSVRSEQRSQRAKGQARIAEVVFARSLKQKSHSQRRLGPSPQNTARQIMIFFEHFFGTLSKIP